MAQIETVRSPANPILKDVRRAITTNGKTSTGLAVAEGFHLLEEAMRSDLVAPVVLDSESVRSTVERHISGLRDSRTVVLPEKLFQSIAATDTSQGVMALIRLPEWSMDQLFRGQSL